MRPWSTLTSQKATTGTTTSWALPCLLKLSREDSNSSDWDNLNMGNGLQRSLTTWPDPPNAPADCEDEPGSVEDPYNRRVFTDLINCLNTDPGLPSNVASEGLVGKSGVDGRLAKAETTPGCEPSGGDDERDLVNFDGNIEYEQKD